MKLLLNQMTVFRNGAADQVSVLVDNGRIISISISITIAISTIMADI